MDLLCRQTSDTMMKKKLDQYSPTIFTVKQTKQNRCIMWFAWIHRPQLLADFPPHWPCEEDPQAGVPLMLAGFFDASRVRRKLDPLSHFLTGHVDSFDMPSATFDLSPTDCIENQTGTFRKSFEA